MDPKGEELAAVLAEIRQRVRARHPNGAYPGDIVLPDLTSLLHARDSAEGKVASIGTVNPRRPGLVNAVAQRVKRLVARALDWHVREQVEFNRAVMACVQSSLEALTDCSHAIAALSARIDQVGQASAHATAQAVHEFRGETQHLRDEARQLQDIRIHWSQWRVDWEQKLSSNEIHFLRGLSELQGAFQHRVTLMDANYRDQAKALRADFEGALERSTIEIQKRLWSDMQRIRVEYETIIHAELRLLRQKASLARTAEQTVQSAAAQIENVDWLKFPERFRGSEAVIKERQRIYAGRFLGRTNVLDVGCGRGEMLEVLREAGIEAFGIDLNDDSLALCQAKGLKAEKADLFEYLTALPDASLGGAVCCQVVEHLPPERLPEIIRLLHDKLRKGALLAIETPNPECLAIFATHFYLDPTHQRPIPPALLSFYLEEAGFGGIVVERLFPAINASPSLAELPEAFREAFFGSLDYAIFAQKLT